MPKGFAHGFQTLADDTEIVYQMSDVYVPEAAAETRLPRVFIAGGLVVWPHAVVLVAGTMAGGYLGIFVLMALENIFPPLPADSIVAFGAFLAALPTLLVYIVLGRYFIRGLLAGSIKG